MQARIKYMYLYWVDIRHEMKQSASQTQIHTNNIVVTQATLKLYSLTGPIPFVIIGPIFCV